MTILLGNGDGTFTTGQTLSVGIDPSGLVVGDFNGDGRPDLAVADAGSDNVMVFLGLGDGTFGSPIVLPVGAGADTRSSRATSSTTASPTSPWPTSFPTTSSVLIGRGDGTFLPGSAVQGRGRAGRPRGRGPERQRLHRPGHGQSHPSGDLTILWGLAGGIFTPQTVQYGGHAPTALAVGDFNGDGKIDLAVADEDDDS